jgi:hypothetical protein
MSLNQINKRNWSFAALLIGWEVVVTVAGILFLAHVSATPELDVWMLRIGAIILAYIAGSIPIMAAWYGREKIFSLRPWLVWYGLSMLGAIPAGQAMGWVLRLSGN